jgi:vitamin B12 transporter
MRESLIGKSSVRKSLIHQSLIGAVFLDIARTVLIGLLCTAVLQAQSVQPIHGTVVDPDHAAVPEATVRLLAADGRETRHTLTDEQGRFSFKAACSDCSLEVQLTGFRTKHIPTSEESRVIELQLAPVQENVVVTPNRTETPAGLVGSTTTVIAKEEIDARQEAAVSDLLQTVPGLTTNRTGGYGAITSLFTRGGESKYTKVLLDGIPVNDPGGAFDFGSLSATGVDHIEVVRGPQSALFGSDAMTGVVQVFSQHGDLENGHPQVTLNADGGNFETLNAGANVAGATGRFDYDAFWTRFSTNNQGVNADFADSTAGTNLGLNLGKTKLRWILRDDLSFLGTPGQVAFQPAINDAYQHKGDGYTGFSIENQTTERWRQHLTYTFDRSRVRSRDLGLDPSYTPMFDGSVAPFPFSDFQDTFVSDTRRHELDYQSDIVLGSGTQRTGEHIFTLAASADKEVGAFTDVFLRAPSVTHGGVHDFGGVFQYQALIGRLSVSNGFRVDDHSTFGRTVNPRSSAAFLLRQGGSNFGATKLKFNFGLGFKEPLIADLFSPNPEAKGNKQLRPERNRSFDFGIEQRVLNDRAKIEVNLFDSRFRDLVEFETTNFQTFAGSFFNLNAAKANGAEVILETAPRNGLKLTASYTYLNAFITRSSTPTDPVFGVGQGLLRRPRHSGSFGAHWNWRKLTASSNFTYVGRRVDSDFEALMPPLTSDHSYTRLDLAWTYRVTKRFSYTGVITNATDRRYMEALGFPALPVEFRTGGRFTF